MHDLKRFFRVMTPRATAATLVLLLTGCALLGHGAKHPYPIRYTLDAAASAPGQSSAGAPRYPITLSLRPVDAPDWLGSRRMLYRLGYDNSQQLSAYTRSAWADRPARMVGRSLDQALSDRHLVAAVLRSTAGRADVVLKITLQDFSQHFASRHQSRGRIVAQATLLDSGSERVIAQRTFERVAASPSADASGGVAALTQADTAFNRAVVHWLDHALARCGKTCGVGQ